MFRNKLSILVMMLTIISIIVSGCSTVQVPSEGTLTPSVEEEGREVSTSQEPTPEAEEQIETIETQQVTSTPIVTETVETKVLDLLGIEFDVFELPGLEYLELGDVIEDCQAVLNLPYLVFYVTGENITEDTMKINYRMSSFAQFRGLKYSLISEGLAVEERLYARTNISLVGRGYKLEISEPPQYKIMSSDDVIIWESSMQAPPRELNEIESTYLRYVMVERGIPPKRLLDLGVEDLREGCNQITRENKDLRRFSPLESRAREIALFNYMEENPNVFLLVDYHHYFREHYLGEYGGDLVVSDASGVLSPFASEEPYYFYKTASSTVSIKPSVNAGADVAFTFDSSAYGMVFVRYFGIPDEFLNEYEYTPAPYVYFARRDFDAMEVTNWSALIDEPGRSVVEASLLVVNDDDYIVEALNSRMETK